MAHELFLTIRHDGILQSLRVIEATETMIGRTHTSALCLPDPVVSRQHAVIVRTATGFVLRDLGSRNGTQLNGLSIVEAPLTESVVVQIGPYTMRTFGDLLSAQADSASVSVPFDPEGSTRSVPISAANDKKRIALEQQLTPAQRRVYEQLLRGRSEKEIAVQLGISINTVHSHSRAIYKRFEVSSRAELISWCGGLMAE